MIFKFKNNHLHSPKNDLCLLNYSPEKLRDMDFGNYIKTIRESKFKRSEWIPLSGCSKGTVESYELYGRLPDIEYLSTFAFYTGANLIEIIEKRLQAANLSEHCKLLHSKGTLKTDDDLNLETYQHEDVATSVISVQYATPLEYLINPMAKTLENGLYLFNENGELSIKSVYLRLDEKVAVTDCYATHIYSKQQIDAVNILGKVKYILQES